MALNKENNNDCCKCTTPEYEIILGAQGPQGRQGEKGEPGFTPIISIQEDTNNVYKLNILTQDGQITTPNLKAHLPNGGSTGMVLTKNSDADGDSSFAPLPSASTERPGIVQLATVDDFTPNEDGNVNNLNAVTPDVLNAELKAQVNTFIVAGDNITTSVDDDGKVTINAEAEAYSLPQANATTLGGIKANPKTDDDTQEVKIDTTTGLLYTKAGGGELPDNVTTQGNTFNGANQLVQLDSAGKLPAIDGSQLTNISSSTPANVVTSDTNTNLKIWTGTQQEYDAIGTKDPNTIYAIKGA